MDRDDMELGYYRDLCADYGIRQCCDIEQFNALLQAFDEETATRLMNEKSRLQQQLDSIADAAQRRENAKSRLDDIYMILDSIKNRPMEYDDRIVRQLLECVVVDSKEQITVIFKGRLKSVQPLNE